MLLWGTLNIHGTFQMQKSFSIFEKGSLEFLNVLQNGYFGNGSLKDSLTNQKWFFYGITAKNTIFGIFIFESVPEICSSYKTIVAV